MQQGGMPRSTLLLLRLADPHHLPRLAHLRCSRIARCILIAGACGIGIFIMFVGEQRCRWRIVLICGRVVAAAPAWAVGEAHLLHPRGRVRAGWKGMGVVVADKYPSLLRLNTETQYAVTGWGDGSVQTGIGFNSCVMLLNLPPFGPVCPWLAVGGLVFTSA